MRAVLSLLCLFSLSPMAALDDDDAKQFERAARTAEVRAVLADIADDRPSTAGSDLPEHLRQAIETWTADRRA